MCSVEGIVLFCIYRILSSPCFLELFRVFDSANGPFSSTSSEQSLSFWQFQLTSPSWLAFPYYLLNLTSLQYDFTYSKLDQFYTEKKTKYYSTTRASQIEEQDAVNNYFGNVKNWSVFSPWFQFKQCSRFADIEDPLSTKEIITIDLVNYVTISNSLSLGMIYDQRTGENSDFKEHFNPNLDRIR